MARRPRASPRLAAMRLVSAIVGGYWAAVGVASAAAGALTFVLDRSEAVVLMAMLALAVYPALLLWAVAERRPVRLWLVLGFGGGAGWGLSLLVRSSGVP